MDETICKRCGKIYKKKEAAISRRDNKTPICKGCGNEEALFDFAVAEKESRGEHVSALIKETERSWLSHEPWIDVSND